MERPEPAFGIGDTVRSETYRWYGIGKISRMEWNGYSQTWSYRIHYKYKRYDYSVRESDLTLIGTTKPTLLKTYSID